MYDPVLFAEKYQLARKTALESKPQGGLCGFELEWNLLDQEFRPLLTVGSGPSQQSFVDYLIGDSMAPWLRKYSQLEVFHWMVEWVSRPYYTPRGAVYESRLLEGAFLNSLQKAGRKFGERLYYWPGNLLLLSEIGADSIPGGWNLAKRRYLERCVQIYGNSLATAGTHTNLSLPDPLLAWDFMHLPSGVRGDDHLDTFKSDFYITATRVLRAFTALFVATSAATPLRSKWVDGKQVVVLTEFDSNRNLTFPNPANLDVPNLYRSYADYLQISYDLVRRGVRFGNNNWTPVRARSFAEPVERLIATTSDELREVYARGLYSAGEDQGVEVMAQAIENQNLMARINLPMARVEVRSDDNEHSLEFDVASLTLKHLLLLRIYADVEFGRAFRYDAEDIARARRNEEKAARFGLRAEMENPFTGKPVAMREFLQWSLDEVLPLAEALGLTQDLAPLMEMAHGGPNAAEARRERLKSEFGVREQVPLEVLQTLAEEREKQVVQDIEKIAGSYTALPGESDKLGDFLLRARDEVHADVQAPVRFRPKPLSLVEPVPLDKTAEVLALSQQLVRIPSVTASPVERLDEVHRAATFVFDYLRNHGLEVRYFDQDKYPAVLAGFPGQMAAPVMLSGHFDVVEPEPDDRQFEPRIEGDYLWGRGAADMKTVVATYLVWMKDRLKNGGVYPPVNLMLIGNEENGEGEPAGTTHVFQSMQNAGEALPRIMIAGERTGERGDELWTEICIQNRGVMRFDLIGRGQKGHSGVKGAQADLTERLFVARAAVNEILQRKLTLTSGDGWQSQARFPFIQVGTPGVYNVTAGEGVLGVEIRPIPQDDLNALLDEVRDYCSQAGLEMKIQVMENGIACDPHNPYLVKLVEAVEEVSGQAARIGKKLPGTSARFAPAGQGVVWGQSGIGPHAKDERHYIPSILPYYKALEGYADKLMALKDQEKGMELVDKSTKG